MRFVRDAWLLPSLFVIITAISLYAWHIGKSSGLEVVAVVTGALCVWLTVKENIWNWPIGIVNSALFAVLFFRERLFSDAGLNVVYVILGLLGWYWWLFGGERKGELRVSRVGWKEATIVSLAGLVCTAILFNLNLLAGGAAPFWDAFTTALCLCAQYLLTRKYIENWFFWIAADLIYVPLYAWKGLYLASLLYVVFIVMCVIGVRTWLSSMRRSKGEARGFELVIPASVDAQAAS